MLSVEVIVVAEGKTCYSSAVRTWAGAATGTRTRDARRCERRRLRRDRESD